MRIRWTPSAADDLQQIYDYLLANQPQLARSTVVELREAVRSLRTFPNRGHTGREEGTRELLHRRLPYILSYRVQQDALEILHIWHPSQDRS